MSVADDIIEGEVCSLCLSYHRRTAGFPCTCVECYDHEDKENHPLHPDVTKAQYKQYKRKQRK